MRRLDLGLLMQALQIYIVLFLGQIHNQLNRF